MKRKYVHQVTYEEMKEYGEFFRSMRKSIGLTAMQMADEIGVHYSNLYRWERAEIIPKTDIDYIVSRVKNIVKKYSK